MRMANDGSSLKESTIVQTSQQFDDTERTKIPDWRQSIRRLPAARKQTGPRLRLAKKVHATHHFNVELFDKSFRFLDRNLYTHIARSTNTFASSIGKFTKRNFLLPCTKHKKRFQTSNRVVTIID